MRALCRGPAKTPFPHRGLYSNRHLASCRHLWFIDCFLTPITPTVGRSHGNAPSIKEALLLHPQWKSCELIQYDCWDHMNMGVLLYYICQWYFSQNSSLDVVRVVFYLSITSDIILLQINNYILEISYRFLDFVSHLAPSMSNILKCNEHQECLKTAKMGYFPMKMHDFPSIFVKSYYQHHIIMEWDVPHLQHIQL